MAEDVQLVDRRQLEGFFKINKKREEYVGYYRLPENHHAGRDANWITWADTQAGKQVSYRSRGWMPLDRYGRVTGILPDGRTPIGASWFPILNHKFGPHEFPAGQVQTYRWYRPENLPEPFKGVGIAFPQLNAALKDGLEIREYSCPECHEYYYFEPWHLATHLSNRHDYDRTEIIALGKQVGIDFTKSILNVMNAVRIIKEVDNVPTVEDDDDSTVPVHVTQVNVQATKGFVKDVAPHSDMEARLIAMESNFARMTSLLEAQLERIAVAPSEVEMPKMTETLVKHKRKLTPERQAQLREQLAAGRQARKERLEAQAEALAHPEHVSL